MMPGIAGEVPLIACSASLVDPDSVHAATFRRAIDMAAADNPGLAGKYRLHFEDDGADPVKAESASLRLASMRPHCVIGHYASGAALAAKPAYIAGNIPLLLPAATAEPLMDGADLVFRFCGSDRETARVMADEIMVRFHGRAARISHDGSLHGKSLCGALARTLPPGLRLEDERGPLQAGRETIDVFIGRYSECVKFVLGERLRGSRRPILLGDDAVHGNIIPDLRGRLDDLWIVGFEPQLDAARKPRIEAAYAERYSGTPGIYFWETYAAMEVALLSLGASRTREDFLATLLSRPWPTVLGLLWMRDREVGRRLPTLWEAREGGLAGVPLARRSRLAHLRETHSNP